MIDSSKMSLDKKPENMNSPNLFDLPKEVILYGGTGQAKVVRPIIEYYGSNVVAVFDDTVDLAPPFDDILLYTRFESLLAWMENRNKDKETGFCIRRRRVARSHPPRL